MQVWPAIDLRGGKCVRLRQGDYARETVFGHDPAEMARHWVDQGADRLHLVDLDGAKDGEPVNVESIRAIVAAVEVPCELGGGIRTEASIRNMLELGVTRLVLGTSALKQGDWFCQMCRKFADQLVLGIDAREGQVATDGWLQTSSISAIELAQSFAAEPLAAIVYTDIATDGMMAGPNVAAMQELQASIELPVVASGGVTTVDDVARLAASGLHGCIIGRALYEDTLHLKDAIAAASNNEMKKLRP